MQSRIRIVGGRWRGRKIPVVDAPGLRPTPDRIRETLFNWLAPHCPGAVVLDCFAGSGALGFEALSRGASRLVMLERNRAALAGLRQAARDLGADRAVIVAGDALDSVAGLGESFDLVFVDPPYAGGELRVDILRCLEDSASLNPGAMIYFEWPVEETFELPSKRLSWLKRKTAGQVNYAIAEWQASG